MRQLIVGMVDFVKRCRIRGSLKGAIQPQNKVEMRQIIVDMIHFDKKYRIRGSLKGTIQPQNKVEMRLVVIRLLEWLDDQARSRELYASEQTFLPLMLELQYSWTDDLKEFVLSNPLAMELFKLSSTSVSFQDAVSTEERLQIEQYVLKNWCPEVNFSTR